MSITPIPKQVNEDIVEVLEEMLKKAKAGEVVELVMCANLKDEHDGYFRFCNMEDRWRMVGALEYMKQSIHNAV